MINYNYGTGKFKNWIIEETQFNKNFLGKCESIMALGNGYLGIRSATEERYLKETRNCFVAGTFNKASKDEVTELPNIADVIQMRFTINGDDFTLTEGEIKNYSRRINLKTAELIREVTWISPSGDELEFKFNRIASLSDLHLIAQSVSVKPINNDVNISLRSGIDAQMTNSGAQHFVLGFSRLFENKYLQVVQTTTQTNIDFVLNTTHEFYVDGKKYEPKQVMSMGRREAACQYELNLQKGQTVTIEKLSNIYTSRDKVYNNDDYDLESLKKDSYEALVLASKKGYAILYNENAQQWQSQVWDRYTIEINSEDQYDQLAIRFATYHLVVMTPRHDNRMNIAAKGLTGEGYKGHTFWDTEIFILPFFTFTDPIVARSLLEYRYLSLPGAHKKAEGNGYEGAQYPWESAWIEDGEVTPVWGGQDLVSGKMVKIWSGFIEQHITSDVAFATWQYYKVTGDQDFMDKYGYELMMDTAKFWTSRLQWNKDRQEYHINDVVGPDEYKEHVNNNAFTNYTAYWNINKAIQFYQLLREEKQEIFNRLCKKLNLEESYVKWIDKVDKIYLPQPREDLVIPQDDTYLTLKEIDLAKYKGQENVGTIFKDYSLHQINQIQVSKQADVMVLFYLLEDLFDKDIKVANFNYYEPRTLHDSSLSLSTHVILSNDLCLSDEAYKLFKKATQIDMGPNLNTSDHGIHAAAQGGLWQSVVFGFGGIRMLNGDLRVDPRLPEKWSNLSFPINWHGDRLELEVSETQLCIKNITQNNPEIIFETRGVKYSLVDEITVKL